MWLKMELSQIRIKLLILLIALPFSKIEAQLSDFAYDGYVKYLFSSTRLPNVEERFSDHLIHTRLNTKWYATSSLTAAMDIRFRAFYGELVANTPDFIKLIRTPYEFTDLGVELWETKYSVGYLEVDRSGYGWIGLKMILRLQWVGKELHGEHAGFGTRPISSIHLMY
jgi:hypothetical protein